MATNSLKLGLDLDGETLLREICQETYAQVLM